MILELDLGNSIGKFRIMDSNNKDIVALGRFDYAEIEAFLQKLPANLQRIRAVSVLADAKQKIILQSIEQFFSRSPKSIQLNLSFRFP